MNDITINSDKCIVVSGKSILSSSAKILSLEISRCTYLEYKTFCDFLESVILHEKIYVLGDFSERENQASDLMNKLNELNETEFIHIINDSVDKFFINRNSIDIQIKRLVDNTFNNEISFIRKQLIPKSFTYRYNDDEKTSFLADINSIDIEDIDLLKNKIVNLFNNNPNSEFVKHLFRGFVIASVASILNGTAKFTGSRKAIGFLIKKKNKEQRFETDLFKLYQHVNTLYLVKQKGNQNLFYQPLLFSIFLSHFEKNKNPLSAIMDLRKEFQHMREIYLNVPITTKKEINKKNTRLENTYNYFDEIYRFASNNNFKNLGSKYSKELLLDESSVEMKYEFDDSDNESDEDSNTSTAINIAKIVKNAIKFLVEFRRNGIINKQNEPLTTYFVKQLNSDILSIENFIEINEFHKKRMKDYDNLIAKNKL